MAERAPRVIWLWVATIGVFLALIALLVPAHIAAVDLRELEVAAENSPTLANAAEARLKQACPGSAQLLLAAAEAAQVPDLLALRGDITDTLIKHPEWRVWGGPSPLLQHVLGAGLVRVSSNTPIMEVLLRRASRDALRETLASSTRPGVTEILRAVAVTNFARLPAVTSAAGQPVEAATVLAAMLIEEQKVAPPLAEAWKAAAVDAVENGSSATWEVILTDLISLGMRLNWTQLTDITFRVDRPTTLHSLASAMNRNRDRLPQLFAAVIIHTDANALASYLTSYPDTALNDLDTSLRLGVLGLRHLVQRDLPIHRATWRNQLPLDPVVVPLASVALRHPREALLLKYILLFTGFTLVLGAGGVLVRRADSPTGRGAALVRTATFTLLALAFFMLLCEPFLGAKRPTEDPAQRDLPMQERVQKIIEQQIETSMEKPSLIALGVFFVVQAALYSLCLARLSTIRRQAVPDAVKLSLIDNEETLFDAGLYAGLGGSILSLALLTLGVIQASMLIGYASTLFGIIFVAIFKIFHLRPYRQSLILGVAQQKAS
jgi:hypothetical protein